MTYYQGLEDKGGENAKSRWTDHEYAQSLVLVVVRGSLLINDMMFPHKHYSLVKEGKEDKFLHRFTPIHDKKEKKRSWFKISRRSWDKSSSIRTR